MTSPATSALLTAYPSARTGGPVAYLTDEVAIPYNRIVSQPQPGITLVEPLTVKPMVAELTDDEEIELERLVKPTCADLVDSIWFYGQDTQRGYRAVVFKFDCQVHTNGYDRDEDGYQAETIDWRDEVTVQVHPWMLLADLAVSIAHHVRATEGIVER